MIGAGLGMMRMSTWTDETRGSETCPVHCLRRAEARATRSLRVARRCRSQNSDLTDPCCWILTPSCWRCPATSDSVSETRSR